MSESNRSDISFIPELNPGATPSIGNYLKLPFTASPDFVYNPNTVVSTAIRSDRQIDDLKLVGIEAGGSIDFEFSYGRFDGLIDGAFANEWNELDKVSSDDISAIYDGSLEFESAGVIPNSFKTGALVLLENAGQTDDVFQLGVISNETITIAGLNVSDTLESNFKATFVGFQLASSKFTYETESFLIDDSVFASLVNNLTINKGDWIALQSATVLNQGYYRIESVSVAGTEVRIRYNSFIPETDSEFSLDKHLTENRLFFSRSVKNGITKKSYSILRRFESLRDPNQDVFSGQIVNNLSLSFDAQSIINGSLGFLGLDYKILDQNIPDNRIKEASDEELLTSSTNAGKILIDGAEVDSPNWIQSASLELNNNSRRQNAVGHVGSVGIALGTSTLTGSLTTYFGNYDLAKDVINNTEKSVIFNFTDRKKRRILLDIPKLKFTAGSVGIPGENTDLTIPLEFQAIRDPDLDYQVKFVAFPFI